MTQRREHELSWASGSTSVVIGSNVLGEVAGLCAKRTPPGRVLIVADAQVAEPYAAAVAAGFEATGVGARLVTVPPGDASKSLNEAGRLYDAAAEAGIGRDGLIVAVGGGMVCDLAGFVGATWLRGVATAYCPTTLEADVDAAIGGKTGLNHAGGKNLIGAFHHPRVVVMDTACLATLSDRDLRAGLAESIKHALIADESFLRWHEANVAAILGRDEAALVELIERNVIIKAGVVARDERETTGIREALNFGHTIGHAIEAVCQYRLRHGECVGLGMLAACRLSHALGLLPIGVVDRVETLLRAFGLPVKLTEPVDPAAIEGFLQSDKKSRGGRLRFVLLNGVGSTVVRSDVPDAAVREVITSLMS